jgi:hypothetical protein
MKLGILGRHVPANFALTTIIFAAYGHTTAFVPIEQSIESNTSINSILVVGLTVSAVMNFARRQGPGTE